MDNPATSINQIPEEVLLEIFSYLTPEEIVRIKFVCRRWSKLTAHSLLWKNSLFSTSISQGSEYVLSFLENAPKLKHFHMYKPTAEIIEKLADNVKDLRGLKLSGVNEIEGLEEAFKKLFTECNNLEIINLPGAVLVNKELATLVGKLVNLFAVSVSGTSVEPVVLKSIADGCPALQYLELDKMAWDSCDMKHFLEQKKTKLQALSVTSYSTTNSCVVPIISVCGNYLKKLQLEVFFNRDFPYTLSDLKKLSGLSCLELLHPRGLAPNIIADVFRGGAMSQLVELRIDDSGAAVNSNVVQTICLNCPNLCKLSLNDSDHLEDSGLRYLHMCTKLEELSLYFCSRLKRGSAGHIFKCQNLKCLKIGPWSVTGAVFSHLMYTYEQEKYQKTNPICFTLSPYRSRWEALNGYRR